jgi:hypothetical protein
LRDHNNKPPEEAIFTNDGQESPKAGHDIELANERDMKAHQAEEAERSRQAQAEYLQGVTPWREKLMGKRLSNTSSGSVCRAVGFTSHGKTHGSCYLPLLSHLRRSQEQTCLTTI